MKKLILLAIVVISQIAIAVEDLPSEIPRVRWRPNPLFTEEGFRLGYVLRTQSNIFWHFEGKFMMGFGSNPITMFDRECEANYHQRIDEQTNQRARDATVAEMQSVCMIGLNPWLFSMVDPELYKYTQTFNMIPVVIYYTESINSLVGVLQTWSMRALMTETLNYAHEIFPTNPSLPVPPYFALDERDLPVSRTLNPAEGFLEGRVVKASLDHYVRKAYEITFQQGRYGNNFLRLNVNSSAMFDQLVLSMLTGRPVRLGYVRLFGVVGWFSSIIKAYSTNYRVTSIEVLQDERPLPPANIESGGNRNQDRDR